MLILSRRTFGNDNGVCRRVEELRRINKFKPRTLKPPCRLRRVAEKPHLAIVFRVLRGSGPHAEPRAIRESLRHRLEAPSLVAVDARHGRDACPHASAPNGPHRTDAAIGRDGVPSPSANHILPFHPRRIIRTKTNHRRAKSNHHTSQPYQHAETTQASVAESAVCDQDPIVVAPAALAHSRASAASSMRATIGLARGRMHAFTRCGRFRLSPAQLHRPSVVNVPLHTGGDDNRNRTLFLRRLRLNQNIQGVSQQRRKTRTAASAT